MTQTVPDISPLMPMHQDPLLVCQLGYLVLPTPPSPTTISFVRQFSVNPTVNRRRYAFTACVPRDTICSGGVRRLGHPARFRPVQNLDRISHTQYSSCTLYFVKYAHGFDEFSMNSKYHVVKRGQYWSGESKSARLKTLKYQWFFSKS